MLCVCLGVLLFWVPKHNKMLCNTRQWCVCVCLVVDELRSVFVAGAGLVEEQNVIDRRLQVNRSRQLKMYRVWIQCKFRKPSTTSSWPSLPRHFDRLFHVILIVSTTSFWLSLPRHHDRLCHVILTVSTTSSWPSLPRHFDCLYHVTMTVSTTSSWPSLDSTTHYNIIISPAALSWIMYWLCVDAVSYCGISFIIFQLIVVSQLSSRHAASFHVVRDRMFYFGLSWLSLDFIKCPWSPILLVIKLAQPSKVYSWVSVSSALWINVVLDCVLNYPGWIIIVYCPTLI